MAVSYRLADRIAQGARPVRDTHELTARHRGHFFDPGTMRAFGSRIVPGVYPAAGGGRSYFVTSERDRYSDRARRFTVRLVAWATGDISEPSRDGFGEFATGKAATRAARQFAAEDVMGWAPIACPDYTHRTYSHLLTYRGRDYCGGCVDDAARALAELRMASDGPVSTTDAVRLARGRA